MYATYGDSLIAQILTGDLEAMLDLQQNEQNILTQTEYFDLKKKIGGGATEYQKYYKEIMQRIGGNVNTTAIIDLAQTVHDYKKQVAQDAKTMDATIQNLNAALADEKKKNASDMANQLLLKQFAAQMTKVNYDLIPQGKEKEIAKSFLQTRWEKLGNQTPYVDSDVVFGAEYQNYILKKTIETKLAQATNIAELVPYLGYLNVNNYDVWKNASAKGTFEEAWDELRSLHDATSLIDRRKISKEIQTEKINLEFDQFTQYENEASQNEPDVNDARSDDDVKKDYLERPAARTWWDRHFNITKYNKHQYNYQTLDENQHDENYDANPEYETQQNATNDYNDNVHDHYDVENPPYTHNLDVLDESYDYTDINDVNNPYYDDFNNNNNNNQNNTQTRNNTNRYNNKNAGFFGTIKNSGKIYMSLTKK